METKQNKPKYKFWCRHRNSAGKMVCACVSETKYVSRAWAVKAARKIFGASRPAFEWEVSIENPWLLEEGNENLEVLEC